jgi:hypothetical protein
LSAGTGVLDRYDHVSAWYNCRSVPAGAGWISTEESGALVARIESVHLCEMAFLDNGGRLCVIGLTTRLPVPTLPVAMYRLMLAVHVADAGPVDSIGVRMFIINPREHLVTPDEAGLFQVDFAGEYILITLRELPLTAEGRYRFGVAIDDQDPVTLDVPVVLARQPDFVGVH